MHKDLAISHYTIRIQSKDGIITNAIQMSGTGVDMFVDSLSDKHELKDVKENLSVPKYNDLLWSDCDSEEPSTRAYVVMTDSGEFTVIESKGDDSEDSLSKEKLETLINAFESGASNISDIARVNIEDMLF